MSVLLDAHRIHFKSGHAPIRLAAGSNPSEHLNRGNSPVLFGCRTGICGTCVSRVEAAAGEALEGPSREEQELLRLICPQEPNARLLCQIRLTASIAVEPLSA